MADQPSSEAPKPLPPAISSSKREDIWALIIATLILLASLAAPEAVHEFFKKTLYLF